MAPLFLSTRLSMFCAFLLLSVSVVLAAPATLQSAQDHTHKERDLAERNALSQPAAEALPNAVPRYQEDQNDLLKRQAGLLWGPFYVGNLKLYLTNPHHGYVGPKWEPRGAIHLNFHVDSKDPGPRNTYSDVINAHIVKYETAQSTACLYIWDSVTKKVIFDKCFDDFFPAIGEGVQAIKDFVKDLLEKADAIASVVIIGALVVALGAAIASLAVVAVV